MHYYFEDWDPRKEEEEYEKERWPDYYDFKYDFGDLYEVSCVFSMIVSILILTIGVIGGVNAYLGAISLLGGV